MSVQRPLRLLSLDGGGVKGLTSLMILQRIMQAYTEEKKLQNVPRPCDVFDLIGGTSTGGLIAIMLGRLRMSVEECIETYKTLSKAVFEDQPLGGRLGKAVLAMSGSSWYSAVKLENAVKGILKDTGVATTAALRDMNDPPCRMFVCTTRVEGVDSDILRNYETTSIDQHDYPCTIVEACMATAAAPLFLPPVKLAQSGVIFVDGATRISNPIEEIIVESNRIWRGRPIGGVVSIGTGWPGQTKSGFKPPRLVRACAQIALSAQNKAEEFGKSRTGRKMLETGKYFRFNVGLGMQDMQADECRNTERMEAATVAYLKRVEVADQMTRCGSSLAGVPFSADSDFIERGIVDRALAGALSL